MMNTKFHNTEDAKGRNSFHEFFSSPGRSAIALLYFLPAFMLITGCSSPALDYLSYYTEDGRGGEMTGESSFRLTTTGSSLNVEEGTVVDVFIFNDDELRRIDSYQRLITGDDMIVKAASRKGKKIAAAIVNPQKINYDWADISSFETLAGMCADLKEEDPSSPLMSGVLELEAVENGSFEMKVEPLLSQIHIRSIRCDFNGRPYSGAVLEHGYVYLTNISTMAEIFSDGDYVPNAPLNTDGYPDESFRILKYPDMIHAEFGENIGLSPVKTDINLSCYPNNSSDDSLGAPFTRLVIAGDIDGHRYYYPININRGEFADVAGVVGIGRHARYVLDITIRQTGSDSPLLPVSPEVVDVSTEVLEWSLWPEAVIEY